MGENRAGCEIEGIRSPSNPLMSIWMVRAFITGTPEEPRDAQDRFLGGTIVPWARAEVQSCNPGNCSLRYESCFRIRPCPADTRSIAHAVIVQAYGGTLELDPKVSLCTTFITRLPFKQGPTGSMESAA